MQARFPVLPGRALVPMRSVAITVWRYGVHRTEAGDPTDPQVVGAVRFALWLDESDQQRLLGGVGLPPVVNDAELQDEFWSVQPLGWDAAGDWRNFADPMAGWPPVDVSGIGGALMAEVEEPGLLAERLADVEKTLNDAVGRLPPGW